ncbi:RNA-binding protein VTS1 [Nakaseomyces bracarensis]|uniref:RNA-binding protein VTS1 n=1 Tax=Nakaseomyces bracarensis TaxID=273131 RepID=A0ABR4NXT5_9SACH
MLANKFDEIHQPVPTDSTLNNPLYNNNTSRSTRSAQANNNNSSSPISNNPLRTAHPGAVLLSPQSSSLNIIDANNGITNNTNNTSNNNGNSNNPHNHHNQNQNQTQTQNHNNPSINSAMSPPLPSSASSSIFFNDFMSLEHSSTLSKGASANNNRPMTAIPLSSTAHSGSSYTFAFQNHSNNATGSALGNMHNNSVTAGSVSNNNNIFMDSFLSNNNSQSNTNSNVNTALNFNNDINQLCTWMSMLNVNQQSIVMDNILSVLNESTLNYAKMKLDTMFGSTTSSSPTIPDPLQNGNHANGHHGVQNNNNGANNSNNNSSSNNNSNNIASPVPNSIDSVFATNSMKFLQSQSTSGSNHFHQAFNSNSGNVLNWSPQPTSISNPAYDYINDYRQRPKSAEPPLTHSHYQPSNLSISNLKSQMTLNQNGSNLAKTANIKRNVELNVDTQNTNSNSNNNGNESPISAVNTPTSNGPNANSGNTSATSSSNSSMTPKSLTDPKLLNNIPIWLKTLRLHKYSDILSDLRWEKLIYLEDGDLLNRGVMALGARRKLLKAFNIVKDYKERNLIDSSAYLDSK